MSRPTSVSPCRGSSTKRGARRRAEAIGNPVFSRISDRPAPGSAQDRGVFPLLDRVSVEIEAA